MIKTLLKKLNIWLLKRTDHQQRDEYFILAFARIISEMEIVRISGETSPGRKTRYQATIDKLVRAYAIFTAAPEEEKPWTTGLTDEQIYKIHTLANKLKYSHQATKSIVALLERIETLEGTQQEHLNFISNRVDTLCHDNRLDTLWDDYRQRPAPEGE